jgi:hypothetical protein
MLQHGPGSLSSGQSFSPALSWIPSEAGAYTATAFVWESRKKKKKKPKKIREEDRERPVKTSITQKEQKIRWKGNKKHTKEKTKQ